MRYRRDRTAGASYFFTVVTADRRPFLADAGMVDHLRGALRDEIRVRPFELFAAVVLPDHLHMIWTLPEGDMDYSTRWRRIKERVTRRLDPATLPDPGTSRRAKGERRVWQRRFWEHRIRDEDELCAFADYIHWNPVKHGLVREPGEWPHSSYRRFAARGVYGADWTGGTPFDPPHGME